MANRELTTHRQDKNFGEWNPGMNQGDPTTGPRNNLGWVVNQNHSFLEQFAQQVGPIKRGRITEVYATTKTCEIVGDDGCRGAACWLGGFSYYMGAGDVHMPSPGDLCLLWCPPPPADPIIIGVCPPDGVQRGPAFDVFFCGVAPILDGDRHSIALNFDNSVVGFNNGGRPADLYPGDRGWMSDMGAFAGVLGCMARMAASPYAAVTTSLIDDLVQIDARTFIQNLIGGCHRSYVDRDQINLEFDWTKGLANALGKDELGQAISVANEDQTRLFEIPLDEEAGPIAKARVQFHLGHNANLLHLWVSKPTTGAATLQDETLPAGLAEMFVGNDGATAFRTTKSFTISKVSKIRLPKRTSEPWTQESKSVPEEKPGFDWGEESNGRHLPGSTDEPRYRRDVYEVMNYAGRSDHSELMPTLESPGAEPEGQETPYLEHEASIEFRDDGSIMMFNDAGSAIEMSRDGDIRISAARDCLIESARHTHVFSGHDMNVRARKNIELTATEENVRLKSQRQMSLYAKDGAVLLESEGEKTPAGGSILAENTTAGIVLRTLKAAPILLHSKEDKIELHSEKDTLVKVKNEGNKFFMESPKVQVNMTSGPKAFELTGDQFTVDVEQNIQLKSLQSLRMDVEQLISAESSFVTLRSNSLGSWSTPTPPGVLIDHVHQSGFQYVGDGHGLVTVAIIKSHGASPAVNVTDLTESDFDTEAGIHTIATMDNCLTAYRPPDKIFFEKFYETVWQHKVDAENLTSLDWNLVDPDRDVIQGTAPFPGLGYADRLTYSSADPAAPPPAVAGGFSGGSLEEYRVFPDVFQPELTQVPTE